MANSTTYKGKEVEVKRTLTSGTDSKGKAFTAANPGVKLSNGDTVRKTDLKKGK